MLTLADVVEGLTGRKAEGVLPPATFTDVIIDSRQARPGSLFVALRGEKQDGHAFVAEALAKGARGAIAEERIREFVPGVPQGRCAMIDLRSAAALPGTISLPACFIVEDSLASLQRLAAFWRRRFLTCKTIGITGSVGKTTTKELTWSVVRQRFRTLKSPGNLNNEIGLPLTLLQLDALSERAVLEMAMYDLGEIRQLAEIALPHIGVVTNVGPTHLERLKSIERIAQAKAELIEALPADGTAILNGDDPLTRAMAAKTKARIVLYGLSSDCDLWADEIESFGLEGMRFQLHWHGTAIAARVPLLGRHSVHTALAAAAVGLVEGETWDEILAGLCDVPEQLRLVVMPGQHGATVLDDSYNASPASTIAALNVLAELSGRKIAVLGDMLELGSYEIEGHRKVGRRAVEVADVLIAVGPRGRLIGEEVLRWGRRPEDVLFAANNAGAIVLLEQILQPGDMVLVKGSRGMRMEEIVAAIMEKS
jgi:UDP-N-acetylmuramoyl-tripeptide--D-alanyl-D-alanine ligase